MSEYIIKRGTGRPPAMRPPAMVGNTPETVGNVIGVGLLVWLGWKVFVGAKRVKAKLREASR